MIWYWIQWEFNPKNIFLNKKNNRITAFIINETAVQIVDNDAWLWVAIEPIHHKILGVHISRHRYMLVAEAFLKSLVKLYGKHIVYSDDETWYPEACKSLELKHILHTPFEKSIIERAMKSVKDRTECFDDYYPCIKKECNLLHVYQWIDDIIHVYVQCSKITS